MVMSQVLGSWNEGCALAPVVGWPNDGCSVHMSAGSPFACSPAGPACCGILSLPNVGGITEMLKIMAVCDTHKVGIVPHFTGPVATAGHMHTMMAFPGQVLMEYNQGERPVPYMPEFLECRNGKVWPNDRPGLGVSIDTSRLAKIWETAT